MSPKLHTPFQKTSISLGILTLLPLLMNSPLTQAATVPAGTTLPIDGTTPVQSWQLENNAILNATNATTLEMTSSAGGLINLTGSNVSAAAGSGIFLTNASAVLDSSTVTSAAGIGISAVRSPASVGGSSVTLRNGSVAQGLTGGIAGNRFSVISLQNSTAVGTGANSFGIRMLEGSLSATGSTITGGLNGVTVGTDTQVTAVIPTKIVLDGTRVEGQTGSALVVGINAPNFPTVADIEVRNRSTLVAGNNTLLEVRQGASAGFLVDNSDLTGNVTVVSGSSANVTLQNNASLTGDLQNVTTAVLNNQARMTGNVLGASSVTLDNGSTLTGNLNDVATVTINNQSVMTGDVNASANSASSLTLDNAATLTGQVNNVANFAINNQALWQMTGSQSVNNLSLGNGGTVGFGTPQQYFQLNVANLSGNGTFRMGTDFNQGLSDLLNVTGSASGNHQLLVTSSGLDPVNDSPIKVVQSVASGAQYGLVNNRVDVGAFIYRLVKKGDDWFLQPDKTVVSTPTRAALAIAGTAPTAIYGEMVLLNNRMGDLRVNGGQTGGWVRSFGSQYSISNNAYGNGYKQRQYGLSMGVDTPVQIAGERVLLGVFAGYSKSDLDLSRGSSGEIGSTSLGLYGTWLGDSGYYLDTVAKLNHFRNKADVMLSDNTKTKGSYNNLGASASVEFGKHIEFADGYYIEPFTQWQAASVQGKDFRLDNGLSVDADTTRSMLGKAGVTVGRGMKLADGSVLQPHVRVAAVHEFVKTNEVRVNDNKFNNDLSGTRFEVAAGASWTLNDRWQLHAELDTSKGDNVTKDFGVNMGAHYRF
ncbi:MULTISPECIES: autotransporter outer membrane beta-barrel domain-containing protein [Pseudomonas]|uniref:Autotransporter outer membrane beta-barrel domain-containing protein n=1 Tax=Pseudomonas aphyarum TaxID=2942629 RepID=A0ABT5PPJ5_9PSED|nr:autotransporter outer membrane beta-barrel domain-containing protein [Pseudomonas aphyarum]MDD0971196.1 autotransporter outer membrane beta-barrel domain-containing protein [Pseudomonas aphyarum]MDD1125838.1 autotransporter outer membrane beta-barrel domain-containing protein [Pseudomonas aphyarum]